MHFLNLGLARGDATVVIPAYYVSWTVFGTLGGTKKDHGVGITTAPHIGVTSDRCCFIVRLLVFCSRCVSLLRCLCFFYRLSIQTIPTLDFFSCFWLVTFCFCVQALQSFMKFAVSRHYKFAYLLWGL